MNIQSILSPRLNLGALNRFICLTFLTVVIFVPYQTKWFSIAPQSILLLLGLGLMASVIFFQKNWKELRLEWPLLLLILCLAGSVIYHQSFNIYTRAYALSIAAFIWLRFSLSSRDIPFLVVVSKLFLITHSLLIFGQILFGNSWYIAQYLMFLGPNVYGVPIGFMDMFLTASMMPALLLLFLLGMQINNLIPRTFILDCCYFITPFAILIPSSRTAIGGFLGALIALIVLNGKLFRYTWKPVSLILCGLIIATLIIPKFEYFGAIFYSKLIQPVVHFQITAELKTPDQFNEKSVIDSSSMSRLLLWNEILQKLKNNPYLLLTGIGLGESHASFRSMMDNGQLSTKVFGNDVISPHNSFIELFYEGGIFCLLALIIFIALRLFNRDNLSSPWFASLIMVILMMLFFDMLRMRFFWIILALVEIPISIRKSNVSKISGVSPHP